MRDFPVLWEAENNSFGALSWWFLEECIYVLFKRIDEFKCLLAGEVGQEVMIRLVESSGKTEETGLVRASFSFCDLHREVRIRV